LVASKPAAKIIVIDLKTPMNKVLRILMLEDVPDDVGLIERTLSKQKLDFVGKRVDTKEEFIESLEEFHPDIILSDHVLPQFNSLEALSICKRVGLNVPFILVTGTVSEEFAVSCMKEGADDYVLKSNLIRLPSAIQNALRQRTLENNRRNDELQLRTKNEELTKINRELDSFVYSVSHNLRAPLMSLLGLLRLVELESEDPKNDLKGYFGMMNHSISKLDETLKEILDYSKNARTSVKPEAIDLAKEIEDSFEKLMYLPGSDSVAKTVKIESSAKLFLDRSRLSVILNNLISNAIKYRDEFKDQSVVDLQCHVDEHFLVMVFRDNGIGIAAGFVSKVFDMFYRATERSEGAGLGLYIVKETVEKLGGSISVESKAGESTVFKIILPNLIGI
jgi:signal transduction histidine kinase